jgi:hypothetical protein
VRPGCREYVLTMFGAIVNLNHPAHTVHWHFFMMTVSNVVVIVLTLIVFAVAVLAPFPGHSRQGDST